MKRNGLKNTLALGLVVLMGAMGPISAQRGSHGGGGRGGGGGHASAHVGSVHYGARVSPTRVGRTGGAERGSGAVRAGGAVRSEHHAGSVSRGANLNPYRDEYFRHFRPGYNPYVIDGAQYYGYNTLPVGYQQVVINGVVYYLFDGVYYLPYIYNGQTIYIVAPDQ